MFWVTRTEWPTVLIVVFTFDGIETSSSVHILYILNYLYYHCFDDYNNYFLCCLKRYDEFNK